MSPVTANQTSPGVKRGEAGEYRVDAEQLLRQYRLGADWRVVEVVVVELWRRLYGVLTLTCRALALVVMPTTALV